MTGINERIGTLIGSGSVANTNSIRSEGLTDAEGESLSVNLPATGIGTEQGASYALTLAKAGAGWGAIIDLEISALEAEGSGKIIANPKLLTADKQEAKIEQGQERIFTTNTLGEGTVVTKKAVLGLTVTPQITPDDRLFLDVEVTKDSFVSETRKKTSIPGKLDSISCWKTGRPSSSGYLFAGRNEVGIQISVFRGYPGAGCTIQNQGGLR
ncbi:MAG: hypothetical protein Ct9H300mP16_09270 [Pseudomonadota bacterium]|nr:MAG: hypothetical protein Ct9H300mP16_09270 [Pseudomonadota bacterium]